MLRFPAVTKLATDSNNRRWKLRLWGVESIDQSWLRTKRIAVNAVLTKLRHFTATLWLALCPQGPSHTRLA
jgi:hypothetical protein